MTIGDRIKKLREELDITQERLAKQLGTTKQNIYKYENSIVTNIPSDKIERLAELLKTTPAYLMGWDSVADKHSDLIMLPIVGRVSCGNGSLALEDIEGYEPTPKEWVEGGEYFYLHAKGNSMNGARIFDGDLLACGKKETPCTKVSTKK